MGNIGSNDTVKLNDKIGEGSYGEVYRTTWRGRPVAAKRIRSFFFENDVYCLQNKGKIFNDIKKEWEIMSGLRHKNIVEYLTVIVPQDSPPIIITELCATDLFKFLREESNRKVSFSDTVTIMLGVAEGIHYLHGLENPVIHRDLSSKNILLKDLEHKQAKITDMGLSKVFPNGAMYATAGVGCSIYAAPETYPERLGKGHFAQKAYYTEKVDIFSFGAVLLEMIVGRVPQYLPGPILEDGEVLPEHIRRSEDIYSMGTEHPLRTLVLSCLDNAPEGRPDANGIVEFLTSFKAPENVDVPEKASSYKKGDKNSPLSTTPGSVKRILHRGYDYVFKVIVLGIPGVGKTSIIQRFLHPETELGVFRSTIDPGDYFERLQIRGKTVHLHIVDTPGEKRTLHHSAASSTVPLIYRGVNGVVLVYDVGCRISFDQLPEWLTTVHDRCSRETPIVVVGNQTDKPEKQWRISSREAEAWATSIDSFYIETSAKGLINIEEIFTVLIEKMIQQKHVNEPSCSRNYSTSHDSWVQDITSRSLLKNTLPSSYGIPSITEKNVTKQLPPSRAESTIVLVQAPDHEKKNKCCLSRFFF